MPLSSMPLHTLLGKQVHMCVHVSLCGFELSVYIGAQIAWRNLDKNRLPGEWLATGEQLSQSVCWPGITFLFSKTHQTVEKNTLSRPQCTIALHCACLPGTLPCLGRNLRQTFLATVTSCGGLPRH